jgi:hypothetical protein
MSLGAVVLVGFVYAIVGQTLLGPEFADWWQEPLWQLLTGVVMIFAWEVVVRPAIFTVRKSAPSRVPGVGD